ncbi:putative leucine-rich repeat domain superfamily [Helianthus anomalus]
MKKLETLNFRFCKQLQQFPDIQSNMDSLATLDLHSTDIEIIVGRFCTNLVSLDLSDCHKVKRIDASLHLDLKKFERPSLDDFAPTYFLCLRMKTWQRNAAKDRFMSVISPNVEPSSIFTKSLTLQLPHN